MKLNHVFALTMAIFFIFGCAPLKTEKTLLSNGGSAVVPVEDSTAPNEGDLDIQPDNASMAMNIDVADRIEITGNCKDLDRKKNRILVEVFAGEDETVLPYISNAISDKCQSTASGLPTTDTCFWVTKGIGIVEDVGLPSERSFPQCHNGRFGFSIKLGRILEGTTANNFLKYTVRFKLRTLDGILADSQFARVTVDRNLTVPNIDSVTVDPVNFTCDLKMSAARFQHGIEYQLDRTFTDAVLTNFPQAPLFTAKTTAIIAENDSVFSWKDGNGSLHPAANRGVIAGVTYTYTLTATENNYPAAYPAFGRPTKASATATCTTAPPSMTFTTAPTPNTCYMSMVGNVRAGLNTEWGYSTTPAWTGPNSDSAVFTPATCNPAFLPTACTQTGLTNGVTYYFAVRDTDGLQRGKWSNIASCRPQ